MTEPTFESKGYKYLLTWPDIKLHAEVSRVMANHDSTRCLIVFSSSHEEANPHILQTRLNLESTRSRNELAKDLASRYPIRDYDWRALTEYLTVKVLREYERGEPVLEISSADELQPLEYLVHPIAPKLKPTVIFGEPGSGKSQFAVVLTIVLCLPWHDNPLRLTPPNRPTPVLFLDYEADPEDIQRQLVSLAKGMGLPYVNLHYRRCSLPLADDIDSIRQHAEDIGAEVVIIDSISLAAGDDPSKPNVATTFMRQVRQLRLTSISLAHTSKDTESRKKTIFGSIMWEAGARSVWEAKGQEDDDALDIALFHRKSNLSRKFKPQGYRITYEGDYPTDIRWHNPTDVAEFLERMSTNDRILNLLKEGATSKEQICEALEIKENTARVALHRLQKKGLIVHLPSTGWGLAER